VDFWARFPGDRVYSARYRKICNIAPKLFLLLDFPFGELHYTAYPAALKAHVFSALDLHFDAKR